MLSEILVYLRLGFEHIADPRGYDHILFLVALTAVYAPREWLRVLILVTAFTVGHTITLVLATLDLVRVPSALVEFLIPITIIVTAALDVPARADALEPPTVRRVRYALALVFGLIHGLGFSTFLRAALGSESSIAVPLLAFNIGLELGQVAIVAGILAITWLITSRLGVPRRGWALVLAGATAIAALGLLVNRLPL